MTVFMNSYLLSEFCVPTTVLNAKAEKLYHLPPPLKHKFYEGWYYAIGPGI